MILKDLRRIAADSNILLSAIIGKAALKVFTHTDIEIVTTEFNLEEVREYLPNLASQYHLDEVALSIQLKMLPLIRVEKDYYKNRISMARQYLKDRDLDDIHLAALALQDQIPIWSNDKDFSVLPIEVYPTAKLLTMLDL